MQVTATNGSNVVQRDQVGFSGLTADDFMRMLITELQNQDPTEPLGNEQLLSQLSAMRNLQSNIELSDVLKSLTTNQQLTSAATFIGKSVSGSDANGTAVSGTVERAFVRDGQTFVGVNGVEVPLSNVTDVAA